MRVLLGGRKGEGAARLFLSPPKKIYFKKLKEVGTHFDIVKAHERSGEARASSVETIGGNVGCQQGAIGNRGGRARQLLLLLLLVLVESA